MAQKSRAEDLPLLLAPEWLGLWAITFANLFHMVEQFQPEKHEISLLQNILYLDRQDNATEVAEEETCPKKCIIGLIERKNCYSIHYIKQGG